MVENIKEDFLKKQTVTQNNILFAASFNIHTLDYECLEH